MQKNKGSLDLLSMSLTVDIAIRVTEPEQLYSKSPQRHTRTNTQSSSMAADKSWRWMAVCMCAATLSGLVGQIAHSDGQRQSTEMHSGKVRLFCPNPQMHLIFL